jgi:hypothetical protein
MGLSNPPMAANSGRIYDAHEPLTLDMGGQRQHAYMEWIWIPAQANERKNMLYRNRKHAAWRK